ncbi:MAG: hypothetical protein J6J13_01965 [Clostridia bacterium]|nr:hypothetical protein [Clostridia bacterium]
MTGYDIYESAMMLLGYCRFDGTIAEDEGIKKRALFALNEIITDLSGKTKTQTLMENLEFDNNFLEAVTYGMCMLLSLGESDREKNEVFTRIYNAKRACVKSDKHLIKDVMPKVSEV